MQRQLLCWIEFHTAEQASAALLGRQVRSASAGSGSCHAGIAPVMLASYGLQHYCIDPRNHSAMVLEIEFAKPKAAKDGR